MSTIAYGMSDLAPADDGTREAGTVSIPPTSGGCGNQHAVRVDGDHRPFVDCDLCAPVLIAMPGAGWAATPNGVALTPDEIAERELAERDGTAMQRVMMKSVTDHFIESMHQKAELAKTPQASAADLFKALSPAERAEFAAMLGAAHPTPAEPVKGTGVSAQAASKTAVKDDDEDDGQDTEPAKPATRGPGRPRKAS